MRFQFNPITDKLDLVGGGSGSPPVESITGNSGGGVSPDASFNINIIGDNATGINTIGNLSPNTLTIFGEASSTTQVGTTRYATNLEASNQTIGTCALTPANITSIFITNYLPSYQGGTGLSSPTPHSFIVANGSFPFTVLGVASNGQLPIGSTGADPVLGNITSTGGTITITNGPGTINIEASATGDVQKLTGNSGGAIGPTAGNINTLGTGSITIAGSGSTLTTQLTGLTNHAIQIGAGTATLTQLSPSANTGAVLQNNSSADPSYSTATYPSVATGTGTLLRADGTNWTATTSTYPNTNAVSTLLYASSANVMSALSTANNGVLITGTTGIPSILADGTTGQILTATTGSPPSWVSPATSGTVTSVSVVSANGFAGTVATATTTPAITLSTTITGVLSGNGTAISGSAITQHDVLVGGATNAITSVAPSATSGVPLISQGASSDPAFGTAVVAGGGTGDTSFTAYAVICGGTTTTAALQSIAGVGTSGQVLTSNGAGALPTFQAGGGGGGSGGTLIQSITASSSSTITFTTGVTGYSYYILTYFDVVLTASNINIFIQLSTDAGSTWVNSGYDSLQVYNFVAASAAGIANASGSANWSVGTALGDTANSSNDGQLYIYSLGNSSLYKKMIYSCCGVQQGQSTTIDIRGSGTLQLTTVCNGIQLSPGSGNFASGTFRLYGVT